MYLVGFLAYKHHKCKFVNTNYAYIVCKFKNIEWVQKYDKLY